jgi:hypothetical protein
VKRVVFMMRRPSSYMTFLGSWVGTVHARKLRSHSTPVAFSPSRTRTARMGVTTSIRSGPICISLRSFGARRDA